MDFDFLKPVRKGGFKKLEVAMDEGRVTRFKMIVNPRRLEDLIKAEMELRTEIHLTLGSELLTYGLDKFLLFVKGITGRGNTSVKSTLKYEIIRVEPEFTLDEQHKLEKLYYKKINTPVSKFIDALGPRVKKVKAFIKDTDEFIRKEAREVATKEVVERLKKTTEDFGFDLNRLSKAAGGILGHVADLLGEAETQKMEIQEYQAIIFRKKAKTTAEKKPQLIINQQKGALRIMGGSEIDARFEDINPELLYDTLQFYLLIKGPRKKKPKKTETK